MLVNGRGEGGGSFDCSQEVACSQTIFFIVTDVKRDCADRIA